MEYALNEMKNNIDNEELGEKADWLFHLAVASASQNPILVSLMNNVSGMMVEAMKETRKIWLYSNQATADRLYQEHEEIYNAIRAKEPEKAQQLMLNHISSVENVLKSFHRTNK